MTGKKSFGMQILSADTEREEPRRPPSGLLEPHHPAISKETAGISFLQRPPPTNINNYFLITFSPFIFQNGKFPRFPEYDPPDSSLKCL